MNWLLDILRRWSEPSPESFGVKPAAPAQPTTVPPTNCHCLPTLEDLGVEPRLSRYVAALKQAYAWGLPGQKWFPLVDGTTFCNQATQYVLREMGYTKLEGLTANAMVQQMRSNGDWEAVDARNAQFSANVGLVTVAGWENVVAPHGHICMVMPGEVAFSSSWHDFAPTVMNIGTTNFIEKTANWAFSSERRPTFFCLRNNPTLPN